MEKTILIVDDDVGIVEVTKIILEESHFHVLTAYDYDEAFECVKTQKPNLILLDIWLAGRSGASLAQEIKKDDHTKHIPIVMISATNDLSQIAKNAGVEDYIAKPFNITELEEMVKKHLQ